MGSLDPTMVALKFRAQMIVQDRATAGAIAVDALLRLSTLINLGRGDEHHMERRMEFRRGANSLKQVLQRSSLPRGSKEVPFGL